MDKPKCKDCGGEMNFYSSMMTFACLKCHNSIRGIVAWNEKEAPHPYVPERRPVERMF